MDGDVVLASLAIAMLGSIVPTVLYVLILLRLDRHEKEPIRMLVGAFLWGAVPAVLLSAVVEGAVGNDVSEALARWGLAAMAEDVVLVPIVEESAKGIALLLFFVLSRHEFDNALDGIVYGAMIGFGFALTEDVLYVWSAAVSQGLRFGLIILFMRTVVFGLNHAFFTSLTGAGVGAARLSHRPLIGLLWLCVGWTVAVLFHAIHNLGSTYATETGGVSLGLSVVSDWFGVLIVLLLVVAVWRKERRWIRDELGAEAQAGVLTLEEYAVLSGRIGTQRSLAHTLRVDGWRAYRRQARLYDLSIELAFKKHQLSLHPRDQGIAAQVGYLRQEIARVRGIV